MVVRRSAISMRIRHSDPWDSLIREAWRYPRGEDARSKTPDIVELLVMDTGLTDIGVVVLEFDVPIIVRELLLSVPSRAECSEWDEGYRFENLVDWRVPDTVMDHDYAILVSANASLCARVAAGESQETCRLVLPLCVLTRFTLALTLRTWIRLVVFLDDLIHRVPAETQDMWTDVRDVLNEGLSKILAYYFEIERTDYARLLGAVKPHDYVPRVTSDGMLSVAVTPDEIIARLEAPLLTRTQILRHGEFHVTSDIMDLLLSPHSMVTTVDVSTRLSVSGSVASWRRLAENTGCWLSDRPFWTPLLALVSPHLEEPVPEVPCHDGICPFPGDARRREISPGPLPPCPRFSVMVGVSDDLRRNFSPESLFVAQAEYAARSHNQSAFWQRQIDKLKDIIN